jgi:protein TonB
VNTLDTNTWLLPTPQLARRRNMYIAIVLSLCVHAAVLAIRFVAPTPHTTESTALDVTLVNARTEAAPITPTILAQNQINAGGDDNRGVASSPLPRTADSSPDQVVLAALRKRQEDLEKEQQALYTQLESEQKTVPAKNRPDLLQQSTDTGEDNRDQESLILNAQISAIRERIQEYNARPRERFVGPATKSVAYAQYVEAWRKKIELLGTEHYPDEARGKVYGELQLTVYIGRDGQLIRAEINRPSDHAVLNLAAKRIVQLAAPFPPLPPEIAKTTDILAITRTWHFTNNTLSTETP